LLTVLYPVLIQHVMQDPIPDLIYVQTLFRLLLMCVFHLYPLCERRPTFMFHPHQHSARCTVWVLRNDQQRERSLMWRFSNTHDETDALRGWFILTRNERWICVLVPTWLCIFLPSSRYLVKLHCLPDR
jgi:hypothetical protein